MTLKEGQKLIWLDWALKHMLRNKAKHMPAYPVKSIPPKAVLCNQLYSPTLTLGGVDRCKLMDKAAHNEAQKCHTCIGDTHISREGGVAAETN